jgi:hypothetical protein
VIYGERLKEIARQAKKNVLDSMNELRKGPPIIRLLCKLKTYAQDAIAWSVEGVRGFRQMFKKQDYDKNVLKYNFIKRTLKVRAMMKNGIAPVWLPLQDVVRHCTPHKKMHRVDTELGSVVVTEDHSLFDWDTKEPVRVSRLKQGDYVVGLPGCVFGPSKVLKSTVVGSQQHTYDLSVPDAENAVLDSGILVHNTYSISGVSLDIEKSSKYESMKNNFYQEADKSQELIKRSVKLIIGLSQPRYGIGISSALGPYSKPGVQSRRNFTSGFRGGWS